MDKKEARRLGEIMVAWADGKQIEYKNEYDWLLSSHEGNNMGFDFSKCKYRMPEEFHKVVDKIVELGDSIIGKDVKTESENLFTVVDRTVTARLVCIDNRTGMMVMLNPDVKIKINN